MKKIFFWSPHINPQVATVKSVTNSLKSLIRYKKNFNLSLINVFGEWDQLNFKDLQKIDLLSDKKDLDKKKYKGFLNSRLLYLQIFFNSYIPLKKILKRDRPDFLIKTILVPFSELLSSGKSIKLSYNKYNVSVYTQKYFDKYSWE